MDILDYNWFWFGILSISIVGIRLLFARLLPMKLMSILTSATFGFFIFLVFPILKFSEELTISITYYSALIVMAYICFIIGACISSKLLGKSVQEHPIFNYKPAAYKFAFIVTIFSTVIRLAIFISNNGLSKVIDVFLGGWAHLEEVNAIGERASKIQGVGVIQGFIIIGEGLFVYLWILVFKKWPKWSLVIWFLGILMTLDRYVSRSELLGMAIVPYLAYLAIFIPPIKKIVLQFTSISLLALVFFSWHSIVRIGGTDQLTADVIISDTLRDAGNSIVPATEILSSKIRGDSVDYFVSMFGFLIPRAIWHDKPDEQYNYQMTYILTGEPIGKGNSVITTTMLGEAWYYFGWSGTIWLMLMFGFVVNAFDRLFALDPLLLGGYIILIYQGFIQIRSTYLTFYQQGVILLLIGFVLLLAYRYFFIYRVKNAQPIEK